MQQTQIEENNNIYIPPKRLRGRPKGTAKVEKNNVVKLGRGRPRKNINDSQIPTTLVFHLNKSCEAQVIINRGGARSSKSYSIMQWLIEKFFIFQKLKIFILRKRNHH